MKICAWRTLIDRSFSSSPVFCRIEDDVKTAIEAVTWPPDATDGLFTIHPERKGNGVKPIKDAFIKVLQSRGWTPEHERIDAHLDLGATELPFGVEWETGNISSSHRAVNRLALGMLESRLSGGLLVLPTRALYTFLTDRVGNMQELEPYFPLFQEWGRGRNFGYLGVVAVEHDKADTSVPLIAKGTDGRALL